MTTLETIFHDLAMEYLRRLDLKQATSAELSQLYWEARKLIELHYNKLNQEGFFNV